jgi:hypothetical protein
MTTTRNATLQVNRSSHGETRVRESEMPGLAAGQVRFRIERFALTANTVTYATTGDTLGYWDFFPTGEAGWGLVPAMGWAEVVESRHAGVPTGGRYYGWYPMARYVDMTVTPTTDGLRDDGAHRSAHAPVYRAYTATDRDLLYEPGADAEDRHALLRGLFVTGWLAEDYFADNDWFGARRVLVLSASSKTAIGFARCADARPGIEVIGVTSARNHAFTHGLGCYDEVVDYESVGRQRAGARGRARAFRRPAEALDGRRAQPPRCARTHRFTARAEAHVLLRAHAGQEARAGMGPACVPGTRRRGTARLRRLEPRVAARAALARH